MSEAIVNIHHYFSKVIPYGFRRQVILDSMMTNEIMKRKLRPYSKEHAARIDIKTVDPDLENRVATAWIYVVV